MNSLSLSLDILKSALFRDPAALNRLLNGLSRDDATLRRRAALALSRLVPDAEAAAPALIARLDDDDPKVRELCALTVKRMGAAATPSLIRGIEAEGPARVRSACLLLLGLTRPLPGLALPAIGRALRDDDPDVRRAATWVLLRGRARRRRSHRPARKARDEVSPEPSIRGFGPGSFGGRQPSPSPPSRPRGRYYKPSIMSQSRLSRTQKRVAATAARA